MPTETLFYDLASNEWRLQLQRGKFAGQNWQLRMKVCQSPLCSCHTVNIDAAPSGPDEPGTVAHFALETIKRKISGRKDVAEEVASAELAEAVLTEFTDDDWQRLMQYLLAEKRKLYAVMDVSELDPEFPPRLLTGDATNVAYSEIFPFGEGFPFELNGEKWLADDQYCVIPGCDCRDAVFSFLHLVKNPATGRIEVSEPVPIARYYYKTGKSEVEEDSAPGQTPLAVLVATVRAAYPVFDKAVKQRHNQLKIMFARVVRRMEIASAIDSVRREESPVPAGKTGRNDPCPCGSGKKHKRCCG